MIITDNQYQITISCAMSHEDNLLNVLDAAGLIHPDWSGIDHECLPKHIRQAVTDALDYIKDETVVMSGGNAQANATRT